MRRYVVSASLLYSSSESVVFATYICSISDDRLSTSYLGE